MVNNHPVISNKWVNTSTNPKQLLTTNPIFIYHYTYFFINFKYFIIIPLSYFVFIFKSNDICCFCYFLVLGLDCPLFVVLY